MRFTTLTLFFLLSLSAQAQMYSAEANQSFDRCLQECESSGETGNAQNSCDCRCAKQYLGATNTSPICKDQELGEVEVVACRDKTKVWDPEEKKCVPKPAGAAVAGAAGAGGGKLQFEMMTSSSKFKFEAPSLNSPNSKLQKPAILKKCQQYLFQGKDWVGMYKDVKKDSEGKAKKFAEYFKMGKDYVFLEAAKVGMAQDYNHDLSQLNNPTPTCTRGKECPYLTMSLQGQFRILKENKDELLTCIALATMMTYVDYSDSDHTSPSNNVASIDGKIKCQTEGATTQDFPGCKHFVNTLIGFVVGQKAVETTQGVVQASKNMDQMEELSKSSTNTLYNSLKAQKSSLETQRTMAHEQAAFYGAKGATLLALYNAIPEPAKVYANCESQMKAIAKEINGTANQHWAEYLSNIVVRDVEAPANSLGVNGLHTFKGEFKEDDYPSCQEVGENYNLFLNQEARTAMKEILMNAGLDVVASEGKALLLNKQAKIVGNALSGLDAFSSSVTIPTFATATTTSDYCTLYPNDLACSVTSRTAIGMEGNTINISGMGSGSTGTSGSDSSGSSVASTGSSTRSSLTDSLGSPVDSINKASGLVDTVGAASLKDGLGSGNAGGGGSGAPGSTSAPSGGVGGDGGSDGGGAGVKKGAMAAYSGGGKAYYSGGLGSGSKKSNTSSNPLEGLLGKNGAKKDGDILDFRNVASIVDKDKDIFKVISNRYENVNKQKRLMEYESVQK